MESIILSFVAGIVLIVIIWGYSEKIKYIWIITITPIIVVGLWYCWGTIGASMMLDSIINVRSEKQSISNSSIQEKKLSDSEFIEKLAQTGDIFGGINALFGALALSGVAAATILQARSLQLARAQQLQQAFEPLFFHLLNLHKEVAATKFKLRTRIIKSSTSISKKDSLNDDGVEFSRAILIIRRGIRMKIGGLVDMGNKTDKLLECCKIYYEDFYKTNQNEIGPHFRTLFHIFKLIDNSSFDNETKIRYANIARSTLTKDQIFLLSINCLSEYGVEFKKMVEDYGLLKHVDRNSTSPTIDQFITDLLFDKMATQGSEERNCNKAII